MDLFVSLVNNFAAAALSPLEIYERSELLSESPSGRADQQEHLPEACVAFSCFRLACMLDSITRVIKHIPAVTPEQISHKTSLFSLQDTLPAGCIISEFFILTPVVMTSGSIRNNCYDPLSAQ